MSKVAIIRNMTRGDQCPHFCHKTAVCKHSYFDDKDLVVEPVCFHTAIPKWCPLSEDENTN